MRRAVHFAVLALVLLFMQHRASVHPIEHLAGRATQLRETVLAAPQVDAGCLECALLAAGTHAIGAPPPALLPAPTHFLVSAHAVLTRAARAGGWYDSRAPPVQG